MVNKDTVFSEENSFSWVTINLSPSVSFFVHFLRLLLVSFDVFGGTFS